MNAHIKLQKMKGYMGYIIELKDIITIETSNIPRDIIIKYLDLTSLFKKVKSDNTKYKAEIITPRVRFTKPTKEENNVTPKIKQNTLNGLVCSFDNFGQAYAYSSLFINLLLITLHSPISTPAAPDISSRPPRRQDRHGQPRRWWVGA